MSKYVNPYPDMRILDIGCAYGYLLRFFDDAGCKIYGIDTSGMLLSRHRGSRKLSCMYGM
ncbi:MAG: hypothetical protein DRJ59_08120 [Thermoprotei archaeon]|nr:MAG: hypothetical protein DRJ59_08120 [Thermoprotei archaeon]